MKRVVSAFLGAFEKVWSHKKATAISGKPRFTPALEMLEDRSVPSTLSSIASNFNGTAIPAGDSVWFNAAFKATGLGAGPVSVRVTDQHIAFTAGGNAYDVSVPDSFLNFSSANTTATTSFDAAKNAWVTNLPMSWSGNAFLGGATYVASNGLPGGINPVTWSGNFATDTAGVNIKWQWGAAVYTQFSSDYNSLNVKPLDSKSATVYQNSDHAGTPEAFKSFVIGGARGGGGSNWTGSYSSTASVIPSVENFTQPASIGGYVFDIANGAGLANVTIFLTGTDVDGNAVSLNTTTDANGFYQFTAIAPGSYTLTGTTATGYNLALATAGTVNNVTNGNDGTSQITDINLSSGDLGVEYNFFESVVRPPSGT